jgi:hypothetical protein
MVNDNVYYAYTLFRLLVSLIKIMMLTYVSICIIYMTMSYTKDPIGFLLLGNYVGYPVWVFLFGNIQTIGY